MKRILAIMFICLFFIGCGKEEKEKETEVTENETYMIAFFDNNQCILKTEAKAGEFVELPEDLTASDPRYKFVGWEGIDEEDHATGKVEVFNQDTFYHAKWYEQFGTDNKFSITELSDTQTIQVDGVMDTAYSSAEAVAVNTVTEGQTDTTATMRFMFDDNYFYIFADVKDQAVFTRDYSYDGEQWTEHNDALELWIDLLHDDSKASPAWTGEWGGEYRGEPGPMCEAHFKINAGYNSTEYGRFGAGSEAIWDGWWSNACNTDDVSYGISKITETGYTVEYRISLADSNIPDDLRMKDGQEIGIGVKIYDKKEAGGSKNSPATNVITLEAINHNMTGPKKLSNFIVEGNSNE